MIGWKFFEERNGMPRTLVHGMPRDGKRSRMYDLDLWLECESGTPGFNFFKDKRLAIAYLPRFRVRAKDLVLCEVETSDVYHKEGSSYYLAKNMIIGTTAWTNYERGITLL